ncbi:uncharacterized protein ATC70_005358 [Mucor velutinosus]|uniref:Uncharacterized protein n=1 Tax=Mucor velutinosus TaxID=708070 RepID=A0AAN7D9Q4_9FUNG|nr:hypothetical protein ATC70_005358 [Mucor velutinosus]
MDPSSGSAYVDRAEKEQAVHSFYSHLYTPETVNDNEIQFFANMIPLRSFYSGWSLSVSKPE